MINPFKEVKWNPDLTERRKFAQSLVIGFPILALVFLVIGRVVKGNWDANLHFSVWLGVCGATAGLIFWALPRISRPFYVIWYFIACCIGIVVANVLMAGFYYLVFTPIALLRRLAGKPALSRRFERGTATYWKDTKPVTDAKRYYRQF